MIQVISYKMSSTIGNSLFIPFVFPNFDKYYVIKAFSEVGEVERIDFVFKQDTNGKSYNAVYIHFKKWHNNSFATKIISDILNNGKTRFYHDKTEYYWIVLPNTAKKYTPGERKQTIDLGDIKSISSRNTNYPEITNNIKQSPAKLDGELKKQSVNLLDEYDAQASEEAAEMGEIEDELEAADKNLISIDYRYVQLIEQENTELHQEIAKLRIALLNLEQTKVDYSIEL